MKRYFYILLFFIVIIAPSGSNAATFTDDLGRKVELAKNPERIISLAPSITETLFYLGLGDKIVGVTDFCNYPPEAKRKTSVGWIISPNVEKIISLKPDLVLATAEGNRPEIVSTLERVKINVYVMSPHSIEDILKGIKDVGELTGQAGTAKVKIAELKQRIYAVKKRGEGAKKARVLYLISTEPLITAGPGSFLHNVIETVGGENIISSSSNRYPQITMEEIVLRDPEVIIVPPDLLENVRSWKNRWGGISAIENNRIYSIDPDIISRPGPRIVDGLEEIQRIIRN